LASTSYLADWLFSLLKESEKHGLIQKNLADSLQGTT